jgi:hypothetical protein
MLISTGASEQCIWSVPVLQPGKRPTVLCAGQLTLTLVERAALSFSGASAISLITGLWALLLSPFRAYQACMGKFFVKNVIDKHLGSCPCN